MKVRRYSGIFTASADVFIQNFRPGAIERMGFSEEVLRESNPKLIYVSISGFEKRALYP